MRYTFTGKNISVTDDIKELAEKKLSRISKLVPDDTNVHITINKVRHQHKVEVSLMLHKRQIRAEVLAPEVNACFDSVVDVLEKQIVKYKGRLRERKRRNVATPEETNYVANEPETAETGELTIHRTKRFALKPMDAYDAVLEMELLDHSFFVFRSAVTDEVNVVYRRNDGDYGLIEPQ